MAVSSPLHVSVRIPSANQCATPLLPSNVRSLELRAGKRPARLQRTEEPCKLVRSVLATSTVWTDTDAIFASKGQYASLQRRCQILTGRPLRLSLAGRRTACRIAFRTTTRCQRALTSCNPLRPIPSPWARHRVSRTRTLLPKSIPASGGRSSQIQPPLSIAR
jgi:hypothetical protein